jgi:hypothetical protein
MIERKVMNFSARKKLYDKILAAAAEEHRTISSWIQDKLERYFDDKLQPQK